jgi:hypothetical protein
MAPKSAPSRGESVCVASGGLWLITSRAQIRDDTLGRHSHTNSYKAVGEAMSPGPQPGHYLGVRDL